MSKSKICIHPQNSDDSFTCLSCGKTFKTKTTFSSHCKREHPSYFEDFVVPNAGEHPWLLTERCKHCGKPNCSFNSVVSGFNAYCSDVCSLVDRQEELQRKAKEALRKKHGVDNPSQISGHGEKVKKTKLLRYGSETFNNPEKTRKTSLERYGSNCFTQTEQYRDALRETSLRRFGVTHFSMNPSVKRRREQTNLERHGVKSLLSSESPVRKKFSERLTRERTWTLQDPEKQKKCSDQKKKLFEERLKEFSFENVKLLSASDRLFRCVTCDSTFQTENISINKCSSHFPRCPVCKPPGKPAKNSLFHEEFRGWLLTEVPGLAFTENDRSVCKTINKEVDFFFPEQKVAIELNGLYWHSETFGGKTRSYHLLKTRAAEEAGVRLLHIFHDEWEFKKAIVKSKVLHILGHSKAERLHARKLTIREIGKKKANQFLQRNHIQGREFSAQVCLGAFDGSQLVGVMTFGKPRISTGQKPQEGKVELIRYAVDIDKRIPGLATRLLRAFLRLSPDVREVFSYADRRWSSAGSCGLLYPSLGFQHVSTSGPSYFYLLRNEEYKKRHSRFKFRKSELDKKLKDFNPVLSEWQNMKNCQHDRIWDCGTLKFSLMV